MSLLRAKPRGFDAAAAAVTTLATKTVRKGLRKGVTAASKVLLAAARAGVPEDTKSLKKALGRVVRGYQGGANVAALVGARRDAPGKPAKFRRVVVRAGSKRQTVANPANYVLLVEKGTKPHALGKGSRRVARRPGGKTIQTGRVHPGAAANPFLKRAMDASRAECGRLTSAAVAAAVTGGPS